MQALNLGLSCRYLPRPSAPVKLLPWRAADRSTGLPPSIRLVRLPPMVSKPSSTRPIGSLWVWQEAQVGLEAWAFSRSRTVFIGPVSSLITEKSTLAGGAGVGSHRRMSISATPRLVGEDLPGWENM